MSNKNIFPNAGISNAYVNYGRYYTRYMNLFSKMCAGRFKWSIPEYYPVQFIEQFLIYNGKVLLFELFDKFEAWNFTENGGFDIHGYPLKRNVTFVNGRTAMFDENNSIIVKNNSLGIPDSNTMSSYASQLAQLDCAIDVNLRACKTPIILKGNKSQMDSIKAAYRQFDGDTPVMVNDKNSTTLKECIEVFDLKTTYRGNEYYTTKDRLMAEAFNALGFYPENDKAERLIVDEVNANNSSVNSVRYDMLKMRKQACDEFNRMTNNKYNISVEFAAGSELVV